MPFKWLLLVISDVLKHVVGIIEKFWFMFPAAVPTYKIYFILSKNLCNLNYYETSI